MKHIFKFLFLSGLVFFLSFQTPAKESINKNEIIFVVEMEVLNDKTSKELKEFSQFY